VDALAAGTLGSATFDAAVDRVADLRAGL
jgi:hypothetical protein